MRSDWRVPTLITGASVLLGVFGSLWCRSADFEELAAFHQRAADMLAAKGGSALMGERTDQPDENLDESTLRMAYLYHSSLARKYPEPRSGRGFPYGRGRLQRGHIRLRQWS